MKLNIFNKVSSVAIISVMSVALLASCTSGNDVQVSNEQVEVVLEDNIIEEDGLFWNTDTKQYVIEEDILTGKVPLKLWVDNEDFGEAIITSFEAKYPGTVVELSVVGSVDAIDKMALEGEAGTGADAFVIPHDQVGNANNMKLLGMMGKYEEEIKERFLETAVGTVNLDGDLYGIPFLTESMALFYNQTLLEELAEQGLVKTSEPAKDFNEILELASEFNNSVENKYAIRFSAADSYAAYIFPTAFGFELFGSEGDNADKPGFNTVESINGLEYMKTIRPAWNVNAEEADWDATTMEFAKGETPYLIMGPWANEEILKGSLENNFEYGITTIPLMDGNQPYTFSGNQIIVASSYSKYPAAARALAMHIASDEILTYAYKEMIKVPALKPQYANEIDGLKDDEKIKGIMKQAQFSKPMPSIPEMGYYWTIAKTMYISVWDGLATPEEAGNKAENDYETLRLTVQ